MCVGSSTRDGLLLLHVRVTVTGLRSHGEGSRLGHAWVEFVLEVVRSSSGIVVLFVHVDVVTTGMHSRRRSLGDLGGDVVVGRSRVFDNRLRCNIGSDFATEAPRSSLILSTLKVILVLSGCSLEKFLFFSGQIDALTSAHSPSRLFFGERQLRVAVVSSWARLICLLFAMRLEL